MATSDSTTKRYIPRSPVKLERIELALQGKRRCNVCSEIKPLTFEYYYRCSTYSDGIDRRCIVCRKKSNAQKPYDPEFRKQQYQKYKSQENAASKAYHEAHKTEINERMSEYRQTDAFKQSKKKHKRKSEVRFLDNERGRLWHARKQARRYGVSSTITRDEWLNALKFFGNCCAVCGRSPDDKTTLAADHWRPLIKGGGSDVHNLIPLCHAKRGGRNCCNNTKKDRMPDDWLIKTFGEIRASKILNRINEYFELVK